MNKLKRLLTPSRIIISALLGIILTLFYFQLSKPGLIFSQSTGAINLTDYITPKTHVSAQISSGEIFTTRQNPKNPNEFIQCKNAACSSFQKIILTSDGFAIQGENYWMDVDNTTFQYRKLSDLSQQATWLPRSMAVGSTHNSGPMQVVGYHLDAEGNITTPDGRGWAEPAGVTIRFNRVYEALGYSIAEFEVIGGAGTGEKFHYAKGVGWVGWENMASGVSNMLTGIIETDGSVTPIVLNPTVPVKLCAGSAPKGVLRPKPCENCEIGAPESATACSQQPVIVKKDKYYCGDFTSCGANPYVVYKDWNANLKITTNETYVPFVGYRNIEKDIPPDEGATKLRSTNLNNYLNDYFMGDALYDGEAKDLTNEEDRNNFMWELGVFRKLAPPQIQDNYKIDMIKQGFKYEVTNGSKTVTMKFWADQPWPYKTDGTGRFPPTQSDYPDEASLAQAKAKWSQTDYGLLWDYLPMFSREDAPGTAILTIEHDPGTLAPADDFGEASGKYTAQFPMAFPHLTGTYQATKALYELIMPKQVSDKIALGENENKIAQTPVKTPQLLAQASTVSDLEESQLLAETPYDCSNPFGINIENVTYDGSQLNYGVRFTLNPGDGRQCHLYVNGIWWGGCITQNTYLQSGSSAGLVNPVPAASEGNYTITATGQLDRHSICGFTGVIGTSCQITIAGGKITKTTCGGVNIPPPDPCKLYSNIGTCISKDEIEDPNPNDKVCCNINANIDVKSYVNVLTAQDQQNACTQTCPDEKYDDITGKCLNPEPRTPGDLEMERIVDVKFDIPYLEKIWQYTAGEQGFFNIFRPADFEPFPDNDAKSNITYNVSGNNISVKIKDEADSGDQTSTDADIYYPYLGGIQQTKKCISEQFLIPQELQTEENKCYFWGGSLQNNPGGTQTVCTDIAGDIPFRNKNAGGSKEKIKANAIAGIKANGTWKTTFLEANFDKVYERSVAQNWNPAFVVALWIEESGASSVKAWDLGCKYADDGSLNPQNNIDVQLECLLKKSYANNPYKEFMLTYSEGNKASRQAQVDKGTRKAEDLDRFCINTRFPYAVYSWYNKLTN